MIALCRRWESRTDHRHQQHTVPHPTPNSTNTMSSIALETSSLLQKTKPDSDRQVFSLSSVVAPVTRAITRLRRDQNVLENSGSTARDHLANERTYLAWIRTSLSLIGASIGILKWENSLQVEGYLIGILGVVSFVSSTWRYFHVQHLLLEGQFEPNVFSIVLVVLLLVVAITFAFVRYWQGGN